MPEGYGKLVLMEKPKPGLAVIILNRPEKRNAVSSQLMAEFRAALADSWDCYVGIITGNGPVFCAGMDLQESRERQKRGEVVPRSYANDPTSWAETNLQITRHPAVFVAAVNGIAIAGGLSLVNSCDLAVASDRAEFGMTEMGFGSFPGLVAPLTSKRITPKHLNWMLFMVQRIDAQTAMQWGLINKVVSHDELMPEAYRWADRLLQLDPFAVDYAKKAVTTLPNVPYELAGHYGQLVNAQVRAQSKVRGERLDRFLSGQPGLGQGKQAR